MGLLRKIWYNSNYHSAANMTPFEVVYSRPPPTMHQFLPGKNKAKAVTQDELL